MNGAAEQAAQLATEVAQHKRLAQHHRRQARRKAALLDELRSTLTPLGVRVIEHPGEAHQEARHGRNDST